ncbi:hypothetical protein Syun_021540 [Stephania yunnanensis]|uniref:Uncharacterized protein n=1 Tax=Stephania yunnanensis TaxID=152371 RepID=A0AAP0NPU4_9MAGN
MEMESQTRKENKKIKSVLKLFILVLNCLVLAIGNTGGPLLLRIYFIKGGKKIWLSSWLETGGWPVMFLPLTISYLYRRRTNPNTKTKVCFITPTLFMASAALGLLNGVDDYFFSYGASRLLVSTSALIVSTQLAFTAVFAFLLTIPGEAKEFALGEPYYYVLLSFSAIVWQFFFMGTIGVIFCASSLLSAVMMAVLLPLIVILAVLILHEKFKAEKAVSLVLSLWDFISYLYGEIKETNKKKKASKSEAITITES